MKTSHPLKQILLGAIVSLTLASCGGGGGGGGESSSGSSNNNNSADNTVQQETFAAPEQLSSGMEFTMTSIETGKISKFVITSPTRFVNENGQSASMEYTRTGDKTCSISYKYDDSPMVTFERKFVFTSATGGDYYHGDKKMGSFTFVANSNNNSSSDDNNNNEPDEPAVADYAPESLPVGKVLEFSHGSSTVYQYKIVSEEAVIVEGVTCPAEYSKSGKNTATLKVLVSGMERIWELAFYDEMSGNAQYNSQGTTYDEYTFRLSAGGSAVPPTNDNDNSSDDESDNADNEEPGSENTPEDDVPSGGFAPKALPVGRDLIIQTASGEDVVFQMISSDSAICGDETGIVNYELLSPDSALFEYKGKNGSLQYILDFSSSSAGTAKNKLTGEKSSFTIGKYAPPAPTPGDDVPADTPEDTTPGDDVPADTPEDTTPGDDMPDDTPENTNPGDDMPDDTPTKPAPEQPVYIAPEKLTDMKFSKFGEYYIFSRGMEYSTGYQVFTGGWYDYKRTGLTTGTLSFRNALYRAGNVFVETQKMRESRGDIKLTFSKTSANKLKVRMEGYVREEVTEYDRRDFPVDINTTTNLIRVYGEYDVTP